MQFTVKFTTLVGPTRALGQSQARIEAADANAAEAKAAAHPNVVQVLSVEPV